MGGWVVPGINEDEVHLGHAMPMIVCVLPIFAIPFRCEGPFFAFDLRSKTDYTPYIPPDLFPTGESAR